MRSTTKKGPRTPALIRAKSRGGIVARLYEALQSAQSVGVMSSASLNAMGVSASEIARAAGFREPPEPESTTKNTPNKPPPSSGGAEACKEIAMEDLERLGQMAAFEWARANASAGCDPEKFGDKVLRVYRACVSPASETPRSTSNGMPQVVEPHLEHLSRSEAGSPARSSADS